MTKRRSRIRKTRRPILQLLEERRLLASDWTNPCAAHDVSGDGHLSPLDALLPINRLDRVGAGDFATDRPADSPFYDADANDRLTPLDALVVINSLDRVQAIPTNPADRENLGIGRFQFDLELVNDSAPDGTDSDRITNDATLAGAMSSPLGIQSVMVQVGDHPAMEIPHHCGEFSFDPSFADDGSDDGFHTVQFTARNIYDGATEPFSLTLDTIPPDLQLQIAPEDNTGLPGDRVTSRSEIALTGNTSADGLVSIVGNEQRVSADATGVFRIDAIELRPGHHDLQVQAIDRAGNESIHEVTLTRTPGDFEEDQFVGSQAVDSLPGVGDSLPPLAVQDPSLPLVSSNDDAVQSIATLLNDDFATDLATVSRSTNEVLVYFGSADGELGASLRYPSGGAEPNAIWAGDFIGDRQPDLAVAHRDGTLSFLEGVGNQQFTPRPELAISGLGEIVDLTAHDFDRDGDLDLVVSGKDRVTWLDNDNDPQRHSPVLNGMFSPDLRGWEFTAAGAPVDGNEGVVRLGNAHVQLVENESFLVSLQQTITIPEAPETLSFDLLEFQLGQTPGELPDAFEVSLLDASRQSLVPAITPGATALLNVAPSGALQLGTTVTTDGSTVTVDISQVAPGTQATLYFDLIGNESNTQSTASLGNVRVSPESKYLETFSAVSLPGPFGETAGVGYSDINGDEWIDVVVEDEATGTFQVFLGAPTGGFIREESLGQHSTAEGEAVNLQIAIGDQVSESLEQVGEVDTFTFSASAGQKLFFDSQQTTGLQMWSLTDPLGVELFRTGLTDQDAVVLTESGTYTLTVNGFLSANGPYQFQIHEIPETVSESIAIGAWIEASLGVPGEELQFEFAVSEDRSLFFDVVTNEGLLDWTLTGPDASQLFEDATVDQGVIAIQQAGQYTLRIDGDLDTVGEFDFRINDVTPGPPAPLGFEQELFSEIVTAGESHRYVLAADAEQVIYVDTRLGSRSDLAIKLIDSSGNAIAEGDFDDLGPIALAQSGDYLIEVDGVDDRTGHYELVVWEVPNVAPHVIELDTVITGAITIPTQSQRYEFTGQAGEAIAFDEVFGTDFDVLYSLTSPTGVLVFDGVQSDQAAVLSESGTYTLTVSAEEESVGPFSFQVGRGGVAPSLPDAANLVVTDVNAPRRVAGSPAQIEVVWTLRNDGVVTVPGGTTLTHDFHLSSDSSLGSLQTDPRIGVFTSLVAEPLAPGESITLNETLTLPTGVDADLFVLVNVDAENAVFENQQERSDNIGATPLIVSPAAREPSGDPVIGLALEDGAEFPVGTEISLTGTATSPPGAINAVFLLDLSGSTRLITDLDANFDGIIDEEDDLNGDGRVGDLLDREIGLTLETIQRLSESATDVRVAVAAWTASNIAFPSGGEILDVGAARFNQLFIDPSSPSDLADLEVSLRSLEHRQQGLATHSGASLFRDFVIGPGNNYDESLETLLDVLDVAPDSDNTQVYYFTDGLFFGNEDQGAIQETIEEVGSRGIQFRAIQAIGPSQVQGLCDSNDAPDWCVSVDSGDDFVEVVREIADGIDAAEGSIADIVIGDRPEVLEDILLPPVLVAGVTVNDVAAESFDFNGNFFSRVTLEAGENPFVIRAIDSLGNQVERQITLVGTDGSTHENLHEVTALTGVEFDSASLNRSESVLRTSARVMNHSDSQLRGPLQLVIHRIEPPSISLTSSHELDELGRPVVALVDQVPEDGIGSSQSSLPFELEFANAESQRFEIDYSIFATGNEAPSFLSSPLTETAVGQTYRYDSVAFDGDGDELTYAIVQGPAGLTIDAATGEAVWTPTNDQIGTHFVVLSAEDGWGGAAQQSYQVDVFETIANRPPLIQSSPLTQIAADQSYTYQVATLDLDGDTLAYSLAAGPNGMTVDSSGRVEWPSPNAGDHSVTIEVSDATSIATQSFVLSVGDTGVNPASPVIHSTPSVVAAVGQAYLYVPFAQDPDGDVLQFTALTIPHGLTVDPANGRMEWSPTAEQVGNHVVAYRVEDGSGGVATQLFSIEVLAEATNLPPSFDSLPVLFATADEAYRYNATAVDPNSDSLQFELTNGPSGMTVDPHSGQVEFVPGQGQLGVHRVELRVTDGLTTSSQTFDLEVRPGPNEPPQFVSDPNLVGTAGRSYFYAASALDADDRFTYEVLAGPEGLSIDPDSGLVSMRPDVSQLGDHDVILIATDDRGASAQQEFVLHVASDSDAPSVSVTFSKNVALPDESVDVYVAAVDNVAIDSISLSIDGIEIDLDDAGNAVFSSPAPGLFEVTATAVDVNGNVGTTAMRLRVIDPDDQTPPEVILASPTPGQQVTYLTDLIGSVIADDLEFYRVDYALADQIDPENLADSNPAWVTIAESTEHAIDQTIATFDPTLLSDGSYLIRVYAQDFSGNAEVQAIPVDAVAPAKLGEFSIEVTDLTIPLAGLPLEVTRRYSTLDAETAGDFGFGWKMGFDDPDIRETVAQDPTNSIALFGATPFVFGTRVYLTNPDGERIGFSFEPERTASYFGDAYTPKFVPDPGVQDRLEVDPVTLSQSSDGSFQAFLIGFPYNPDQYRLVRPSGEVYQYDQHDGLEKVTDANGNELVVTEDGVTHSSGESIEFVRDSLGRIQEIIDPAGHSIAYQYDALGRLSMVTNQEGETTEFRYAADPMNYLVKIVGHDGNINERTEYDDNGRIVAIIDAEGNRREQSWDPANFFGAITDANGNMTTLLYNERGNVIEETDAAGNVTYYEYGDERNPDLETRVVDRRGFVTEMEYDDAGNLTSTVELGPVNNAWDQPLVTSFSYDASGQLSSRTDPRGHETRWEYDAAGNLQSTIDPELNVQTSKYDERGRLIERSDFNQNWTTVSYSQSDQVDRVTFADGSYVQFQFNALGQFAKEQVFEADGTLVQQVEILYDRAGRVATEIVGVDEGVGHSAMRTYRVYDGNLLDYVVVANPGSLDAEGLLLESPSTPVEQRLSAIVDYEYDSNGRLIRETDPQGGVTEYRYDGNGNPVLIQDPVGNITTWIYDSLNRVSETRDPFYNQGMTLLEAMAAREFPSGADCGSNATSDHVVLSCYDAEGNLVKRIDRNGRRFEFDHDHRGRVLEERWYSDQGGLIRTASFAYDEVGNLISASDPDSHYEFEYDSLDRLISSDNNPSGSMSLPHAVLSYRHDANGNIIQTMDQSGVVVDSEYDQRDRLQSRRWSGSELEAARIDFVYNAAGRETLATRFDGNDEIVGRTIRTYDVAARPDSVTHMDAADELFAAYEYDYDFASLVDSKEVTLREATESESLAYRYDLNAQVVESTSSHGTTEAFEYDLNGNRITPGNLVGHNNQLLADAQYTYQYDAEGNLVARTETSTGNVTSYQYDHRNRLVEVRETNSEGVVLSELRYTYDVFNRRITQTTNGETLHTVYNADNAWADFADDGQMVTRYLFGEQVDQILARQESSEETIWHLTDRQGSVRQLVDSSGTTIASAGYDTFGNPSASAPELIGRYLYAGREYDSGAELYYNRARFYDPLQGRFLSQDPLGFNAGDLNLYRYVGNSPVNGTDPTGETSALEYSVKAVYTVAVLNLACAAVDYAADLELDYEPDPAKIALQGFFAAGSGVLAFGFGPIGALVLGLANASLNLYACATGE